MAFLQQRMAVEEPEPDEFSTASFVKALDSIPRDTAVGWLEKGQMLKLLSSRRLGRNRYWKIIDQKAWQDWLSSHR